MPYLAHRYRRFAIQTMKQSYQREDLGSTDEHVRQGSHRPRLFTLDDGASEEVWWERPDRKAAAT